MRRSDLFLPTTREHRGAGTESTRLLTRAGLVREFGSGLWGFTPVGLRVERKIARRIRVGMDDVGGQSVDLPGLQYRERWARSGRWGEFEGEMFTLTNRDGAELCLAPSHEEGMVHLVDGLIRSYEDLPLLLYQVDSKFRDDHARGGLLRCKEFTMKDAYSFHLDRQSLDATYREVRAAYERIFADLGLRFVVCEAENRVMGGTRSEEFVAPVDDGTCRLRYCDADACRYGVTDDHSDFESLGASDDCPDCGSRLTASEGVEVGHIFQLGTRYSAAMGLTVDDDAGVSRDVEMGSYGIGVDRLLQTLAMQHADGDGCRWPVTDWGSVGPYRAAIVPIGDDAAVREAAERLHETLGGDCLLFDDETQSVGERFAESDLLGIPAKMVVGNTYRETGNVEIEDRDGRSRLVSSHEVVDALEDVAGTRV